jgi:hypothetical protein
MPRAASCLVWTAATAIALAVFLKTVVLVEFPDRLAAIPSATTAIDNVGPYGAVLVAAPADYPTPRTLPAAHRLTSPRATIADSEGKWEFGGAQTGLYVAHSAACAHLRCALNAFPRLHNP